MACIEEKSLTLVLNLSCQKGWITENEKLQIKTRRTFNDKKAAVLELLYTMECNDNAARLLLSLRCINDMNTPEHPDGDENRFLAKIMSKLFSKGLVTKKEMLECGAQLQERKKVKGPESLDHMDISSDSDDNQGFFNGMNAVETIKNPLQLNPVIKCVLQYLKFEEIKTSRLISKEWASVALNVLIPRSKITFGYSQEGEEESPQVQESKMNEKYPVKFFEVFPEQNERNTTFDFSNFTIRSWKQFAENPWTIEELNYFFRNQQQYITHLKLSGLYLVDDCLGKVDSFDISPWISNSPMAIGNSKTKTKLSVRSHATKLSVQSGALSNVKDLKLDGCTVNLQDGIRISPINLEIRHSIFNRDGNQLAEVCVNDFMNFTEAKNIYLPYNPHVKFSLDLNGCHELECLELTRTTLRNWTTSRWTVGKLNLSTGIPFTEKTQMKIKELSIRYSQIDISVLPQSLEYVVIDSCNGRLLPTQPTILCNLKKLKLYHLTTNNMSNFFLNAQFPNLRSLEMEMIDGEEVEMDLAWLSTSTKVKILKLTRITITNDENKNLNLDKLVLCHYLLSKITEICGTHIQTKELLIDWNYADFGYTDLEFLDFLESQKSSQDCGQRIYVGGFNQIIRTKAESPLCPYLDSGEEFCVFENNLGKAMKLEEFCDICNVR